MASTRIDGGRGRDNDHVRTLSLVRRAIVASLAICGAVGAVLVAEGPGRFTTYAGVSATGAVLTVVVVLSLTVAGLALAREISVRPDLALLAALVWTAPIFAGWPAAPPPTPSLAAALAGLAFPLLVHLVLIEPGRSLAPWTRTLIVGCYAEAVLAAVVLALIRDPYLDPDCWANCGVNSFLVEPLPMLARRVQLIDRWFVAAAAAALCVVLFRRLVMGSAAARRLRAPVAVPAIGFGVGMIARAAALQVIGPEDPLDPVLFGVFVLNSIAVTALALGLSWGRLRARARRRAVQLIAASFDRAPAPGTLQTALATTLKDPELRIAYWLEASAQHVDAWGAPVVLPPPGAGRSTTRLLSGSRTIAVISHATGVLGDATQLGPTLRLGLDNERLQAELLGRLAELRSSRTRIVATADAARQRLERDLHDGVQQRLLSLVYDIRRARQTAAREGDHVGTTVLDRALAEIDAAIDELRELAHGLFPVILADSGLVAAVRDLADTSPFPIEVNGGDARVPQAVEAAAYFAAREALEAAGPPAPDYAEVEIDPAPDRLLVTMILGDAPARTTAAMLDRVGALGGQVSIESSRLIVEIPCA